MNIGETLLKAVINNPNDITYRLVYADYLEEEGNPYGEFIRVQCELYELETSKVPLHKGFEPVGNNIVFAPKAKTNPLWVARERRKRELRSRQKELFETLSIFEGCNRFVKLLLEDGVGLTITYRQGFIEKISCSLESWDRVGSVLVRKFPLTEVVLSDKKPFSSSYHSYGWYWLGYVGNMKDYPDCLSVYLWDRLSGGTRVYDCEADRARRYETEDDAMKGLSQACLAYARVN